jgi:hypothetical protein
MGTEHWTSRRHARPPVLFRRRGGPVLDAEFRVVRPAPRLWRLCRDFGWALGPYLVYCLALWALAAAVGLAIDRGGR